MRAEIRLGVFELERWFPDVSAAAGAGDTISSELWRWYDQASVRYRESTLKDYRRGINALAGVIGEKRLGELTRSDVADLVARLGATLAPKTVNNTLTPLRWICRNAMRDGELARDPCEHVHNLRVRRRSIDPFSLRELRAILDALLILGRPQVRNLVQFAAWTGLRTGELIGLEWSDIDYTAGHVQVERSRYRGHNGPVKTPGSVRLVALLEPAADALRRQKGFSRLRGPAVFLNPNTSRAWYSDKAIREVHWRPALKRAGVRYRPPYNLRHTYASIMVSSGESPVWVAQQLGHADPGVMWKRYARWIELGLWGHGSAALEAWAKLK